MNNIVITGEDVMQALNNLNLGKSVGRDNIHPKLLIECNEKLLSTHEDFLKINEQLNTT